MTCMTLLSLVIFITWDSGRVIFDYIILFDFIVSVSHCWFSNLQRRINAFRICFNMKSYFHLKEYSLYETHWQVVHTFAICVVSFLVVLARPPLHLKCWSMWLRCCSSPPAYGYHIFQIRRLDAFEEVSILTFFYLVEVDCSDGFCWCVMLNYPR